MKIDHDILQRQLTLAVDGRITFDAFVEATYEQFERMAMSLIRRWVPPAWYGLSDVIQELYLGAWHFMWTWDPNRGPTHSRYVVFNSMASAKYALHKARKAKLSGSTDRNPSRFEVPFSKLLAKSQRDETSFLDSIFIEETEAETLLLRAEESALRLRRLLDACEDPIEKKVISLLFETRDVDEAGAALYQDLSACDGEGPSIPSEDHAVGVLLRHADRVRIRCGE